MRIFIVYLILILPVLTHAQNNEKNDPDSSNMSVRINPIKSFSNEITFFVSKSRMSKIGLAIGYIHPNSYWQDYYHDISNDWVIKNSRQGFLLGGFWRPNKKKSFTLDMLFRLSKAKVPLSIKESVGSDYYRETYTEQKEFSTNLINRYYIRIHNKKLIHEIFIGPGIKLLVRNTKYDRTSGLELLEHDNGFFILPTFHLGYLIGMNFY